MPSHNDLRNAKAMIKRAEELVTRQRERLAVMESKDDSYELSRRVLLTLEEALLVMTNHRDLIAQELKQQSGNETLSPRRNSRNLS
jgi:hypothetical protein